MSDPAREQHPAAYAWRDRFPDAERLVANEGGASYSARAEDSFWVIIDEGALADFALDEDQEGLVAIECFEDEALWRRRCIEVSSRAFLVRLDDTLRRYLREMPALIEERAFEAGLEWINERDHLQPWSWELGGELLERLHRSYGGERRSAGLDFPDHFPRVGNIDIAISERFGYPAFLELKCGPGPGALAYCAWDLLKLSLCLQQGVCSAAYLVAATEAQNFEEGDAGTEFLEVGTWEAAAVRERYAKDFRSFETRGDPSILRVPASVRTEPVGSASFEIAGTEWSLRVSRVVDPSESALEWEPFLS